MHVRERCIVAISHKKIKEKTMWQERCVVHMAVGSPIDKQGSYAINGGEMSCRWN